MKKTIKRLLASFMVAVMVLTAAPLNEFVGVKLNLDWLNFDWIDFSPRVSAATSGSCGENLYWTFDEATGELVIGGTGEMDNYTGVSSIPWYSYHLFIKKLTIDNDVTSLGSRAFQSCTNLENILIPDSVISIGSYTFDGCIGLTNVTIPDSVTSIGERAFERCSNLESVTISENVSEIETCTFEGCINLKNICIPNKVTSIGERAFSDCYGLTSIIIPHSVKKLNFWHFTIVQTSKM